MHYTITLYRRERQISGGNLSYSNMPVQHFNADTLAEARQKMLRAQAARFAYKVELSVTLDVWHISEAP
jgi:hypothetical protein